MSNINHTTDSSAPGLPDDDELVGGAEAARILNVKEMTLPVWRSTKRCPKLKYVKMGSAVRYRRGDLRAFVASCTVN